MKLTSGCKAWFEKFKGIQSVKKLRLEGSLRFSTVTEVFGPQSWFSLSQPVTSHPTSRRSVLILSTHLHIGLPCRFPTSYLVLHISPVCPTSPTFFILRHSVILTIDQLSEEFKLRSTSFCNFHHHFIFISFHKSRLSLIFRDIPTSTAKYH
jgi:hypothetical protein